MRLPECALPLWPRAATVSDMGVLLLRLSGPMQSWGDSSRFTVRATRREPTKSGVVGLLASALGRTRGERVDDLCALEFGVRIDQPGEMLRDFQTARSMDGGKTMPLSNRYFLSDAKFLVALGGPQVFLDAIGEAVRHPVWPLYLGRRSYAPAEPIAYDQQGGPYDDVRVALESEPWIASSWYRRRLERRGEEFAFPDLEVVCDAREGELDETCLDVPLSFGDVRRYVQRAVARSFVPNPDAPRSPDGVPSVPVDHDPMSFY